MKEDAQIAGQHDELFGRETLENLGEDVIHAFRHPKGILRRVYDIEPRFFRGRPMRSSG